MADANTDSKELALPDIEGLNDRERRFVGLIVAGNTAKRARELAGIGVSEYRTIRLNKPAFTAAVRQARAIVQEELVDRLDEIAEREPDVQRAKLMSDNIKWKAGKYNPQTFGERLEVNATVTIDISNALAEARNRALVRPMRDLPTVAVTQVIDSTCEQVGGPVDKTSTSSQPDIFS